MQVRKESVQTANIAVEARRLGEKMKGFSLVLAWVVT